ncbi:MAG: 1-(5-phosphoribosyl)-5-[(5-phosphoribosylamino)methylideneamino]imidazole-4-carboxamide isomerase [Candidatus Omnitrophota bacterium]|nr:MAG: 1-(5-phosphoribosyl)-5-[(5-phosphoribosylamino)methylideneamino]imidazole-4-carboxamide isomerase [Candidatus Omnitrophota bacterium]
MLIIPAIDLYKGKVVRLTRGKASASKVYSNNPLQVVQCWQEQGAELLHVVDLSAALGEGDNRSIIKEIIKEANVDIEVGGGIRSIERAQEFISLGAKRVVVGTKGFDDDFLSRLIAEIGSEKVAVGVDVRDSYVAVEGWRRGTKTKGLDFIVSLCQKGIKWIIYTDISRDGTLQGADEAKTKELSLFKDINLIFSGGISSLDDLRKIKKNAPFIWGVIIGKALYERKIDLPQAISLSF